MGVRLGVEHAAGGVEELDALAHEAHAREDDRVALQRLGEAGQVEGVAHVVGQRLGLGGDVVVREDHGVLLALELLHALADVRELPLGQVRATALPIAPRRLAQAFLLDRRVIAIGCLLAAHLLGGRLLVGRQLPLVLH